MKKTSFLTVGLIIIGIGMLNAQTNQGKFLLGLSSDIFNIGYTTTKQKSDSNGTGDPNKSFNFNLHPKMGYFVIENLAIGLDFFVGLQLGAFGNDSEEYTFLNTQIGAFARYYVPTSKVLPFIELGGSLGSAGFKSDYNDHKSGVTQYGGGIGLAVPLGEKVMLDVLAGYQSTTFKDKEDNEDNVRSVTGTLGLEVGFVILLGSN